MNYIDHSLIVIYTVAGCVSISSFASLGGIPIGIAISTIRLNFCVTTAGIKKVWVYNSKKKRGRSMIK